MNSMKFVYQFIKKAKSAGFTSIRCYVEKSQGVLLTIFEENPELTAVSNLERVFMEGEWMGKTGSAYTEHLEENSFDELMELIRQSAECGGKAWNYNALKSVVRSEKAEVVTKDDEEVIKQLLEAENAAFTTDNRIQGVNECWYERKSRSVILTDGQGVLAENCGTAEQFAIKVSACENGELQTCYRTYLLQGNEDLTELARNTALETVAMLGAQILPTDNYPVILQSQVVAVLIGSFLPAFYADNIKSGMSCLCTKGGTQIANSKVTLREEPLFAGTSLQRRFDDEGEPTHAKDLICKGYLTTLLYNRATAKEGESTGNGFRTEYKQPVTTGVTNIILQAGESSEEELMELMEEGVIITHIEGAFAGAKYSSGDFSLLAKGFLVRNGKVMGAVHRITIAGDFVSMLESVQSVGKDLRTWFEHNRTITAPSILLKKLSISGV